MGAGSLWEVGEEGEGDGTPKGVGAGRIIRKMFSTLHNRKNTQRREPLQKEGGNWKYNALEAVGSPRVALLGG